MTDATDEFDQFSEMPGGDRSQAYKLWLDDKRDPPSPDWIVAKDYDEFRHVLLARGAPSVASLDHDLAAEHYAHLSHPIPYTEYTTHTGMSAAAYLKTYCECRDLPMPECIAHTWNKAGAENILKELGCGTWKPDAAEPW